MTVSAPHCVLATNIFGCPIPAGRVGSGCKFLQYLYHYHGEIIRLCLPIEDFEQREAVVDGAMDDEATGCEALQHISRQRCQDGGLFDITRLSAAVTDPASEAGRIRFDDRPVAR